MRRPIFIMSVALTTAACGGSSGYSPDVMSFADPGSSFEIGFLPDAVVLEQGSPDFAVTDSAGAQADDASKGPVAESGFLGTLTNLAPLDKHQEYTAITEPAPDNSVGCGPDDEICEPGQACVLNSDTGKTGCMFVAECSGDGAVEVEDIIKDILFNKHFYIKIEASVWMGSKACTLQVCPADDPCCNQCFAPLFVGTEYLPLLLLGDGVAIGCQGSSCDFDQMCKPMVPDKRYWIWGMVDLLGGKPQITVDGFCIVL
ncbi:MAG: hypothetical protein GXP54_05495 [Deltaproteobacteria bacterium]|nr:hypothetical protein [Deltaproteobacteria bacterium]